MPAYEEATLVINKLKEDTKQLTTSNQSEPTIRDIIVSTNSKVIEMFNDLVIVPREFKLLKSFSPDGKSTSYTYTFPDDDINDCIIVASTSLATNYGNLMITPSITISSGEGTFELLNSTHFSSNYNAGADVQTFMGTAIYRGRDIKAGTVITLSVWVGPTVMYVMRIH